MSLSADDEKEYEDMYIANNHFDGCGVARFWQPACIWADGRKNVSVINNEATNVPNHPIRLLYLHCLSLHYTAVLSLSLDSRPFAFA